MPPTDRPSASPSSAAAPIARGGLATIAVNPTAARASSDLTDWVARAAIATGHRVEVDVAQSAGGIGRAARAACMRGDDLFIVVGGDGSVAEAASALAGSDLPLLIVPAGTGNLLATALGQTRNRRSIEAILRAGRSRVIDLGAVEAGGTGGTFAVAAGIGFDAAVMAATPAAYKRRAGEAAYVLGTLREIASVANTRMRLTTPEFDVEIDASTVLAANCLDRALGIVRPRVPIDPSDGMLDVFVAPAANGLAGLVSVARLVRAGVRRSPHPSRAFRFRTPELTIEAARPLPFELDGDPHPPTGSLTIRCLPQALRVAIGPA